MRQPSPSFRPVRCSVCMYNTVQYHDQRTPYSRVVAGHTPPRPKVVTLVSSETGDVLPNPSLSPEPVNLATRLIGCMELSINLKRLKKFSIVAVRSLFRSSCCEITSVRHLSSSCRSRMKEGVSSLQLLLGAGNFPHQLWEYGDYRDM